MSPRESAGMLAILRAVGDADGPDRMSGGIVAAGLGKRFGRHMVLDGVTFRVPAGEVFGLLGANGSGKTTLLRVLAALLHSDEGDAWVGGVSVTEDAAAVRASIGYMPAFSGRYPRLTAQEYLEFYAGVHRLPRDQRPAVAVELLELVGLAGLGGDEVDRLSRGHQQRLGLARALVHDPGVLLLDDTSGLDAAGHADLRALLGELRHRGKTVLVAAHRPSEVAEMCTWAGLLEGGAVVAAGPVAGVLDGLDGRLEGARVGRP